MAAAISACGGHTAASCSSTRRRGGPGSHATAGAAREQATWRSIVRDQECRVLVVSTVVAAAAAGLLSLHASPCGGKLSWREASQFTVQVAAKSPSAVDKIFRECRMELKLPECGNRPPWW
mmetsp:Transcript_6242/g.19290  ORF Transcript_6242/g.19290 Transcript_6242/m.19290 type:complete len:121 (+) Transcript_6242:398-760(+)